MKNKYFITAEIKSNLNEEELNKAIFHRRDLSDVELMGLTVVTDKKIPLRASRKKALSKRNEAIANHITVIEEIGPIV